MKIDVVKVTPNEFRMTSNGLKTTSNESNTKSEKKTKINLKGGSVHDNFDFNEKYLVQIFQKNTYKWI